MNLEGSQKYVKYSTSEKRKGMFIRNMAGINVS
jgi:hypothetical protein